MSKCIMLVRSLESVHKNTQNDKTDYYMGLHGALQKPIILAVDVLGFG